VDNEDDQDQQADAKKKAPNAADNQLQDMIDKKVKELLSEKVSIFSNDFQKKHDEDLNLKGDF